MPKHNSSSALHLLNLLLEKIPGQWHFSLCGSGEPFLTPNFFIIIKRIITSGHRIGVMTNLSLPLSRYEQFCNLAGDNLNVLSASYHKEMVQLNKFINKAKKLRKILGYKFRVVSVARPGKIFALKKDALIMAKYGIRLKMQLERDYQKKTAEEPYVDYKRKEDLIIKKYGGSIIVKKDLQCQGRKCWAGVRYFVLNERGDAWRCNPALRYRNKKDYLGNLFEGTFAIRGKASLCRYKHCHCTDPIALGMVEGKIL